MSGPLYPVHQGCGGPLVPAVEFPDLEDGAPLICSKCHGRTHGQPGDLGQATLAALAERSSIVFNPPKRGGRRPGVARASAPIRSEEQLELLSVGERRTG